VVGPHRKGAQGRRRRKGEAKKIDSGKKRGELKGGAITKKNGGFVQRRAGKESGEEPGDSNGGKEGEVCIIQCHGGNWGGVGGPVKTNAKKKRGTTGRAISEKCWQGGKKLSSERGGV